MLSLIAFLPGFARMPTIDRDEARFAQASKQMIASGDFVDIRFQNEVRYKKPVGIYWMQAAAVKASTLLGRKQAETRISAYRLPSLFGAIGAVLLTYWTALTFVSRRASVVAAVMMAACVLLGVEARLAKTDAVLLFTVVAAMGAMARVYLDRLDGWSGWQRQWLLPVIFWGALGLGVLVKGPLILLIVGLSALTLCILDRSARWLVGLKPLVGVPIFLALVLPWFVAIYARSGSSFFAQSAGDDMLRKIFSGQESRFCAAGLFFRAVLPDLLAGLAAGGTCDPYGLARSRRGPGKVSAGVAGAEPGSCSNSLSPSCRIMCCRSIPRSPFCSPDASIRTAVAHSLDGIRDLLVVRGSGHGGGHWRCTDAALRRRLRLAGLAASGGIGGVRPARLVAL